MTRSYDTEDQALIAGAKLRADLGGGVADALITPTIGDLLFTHVASHGYAATTHQDLLRIATKLPADVRNLRVSEVTPLLLTNLYQDLLKRGWATSRVLKFHNFLSSAYGTAILHEWAESNPCRDAKKPKASPRKTGENVDEGVINLLRERLASVNPDLPIFVRLSANCGARRGEMVALKWSDVDELNCTLMIVRSLSEALGAIHETPTKTGSKGHRKVGISGSMMTELATLRREGPWVFSHDGGLTPWRPSYVTRAWTRVAKGTGVRLHDLRHFMVTRWLSEGVPVHEVSARAGHSNPVMTQKVYAHAIPARDRENAERLSI